MCKTKKTIKQAAKRPVRENKLSRQDYVAISRNIGKAWTGISDAELSGALKVTNAIALFLKSDNPRFDNGKFLEAIAQSMTTTGT